MATQCEIVERVYEYGPPQQGTESDAGYGVVLMEAMNNVLIELDQFAQEEKCEVGIDTTPILPPPSHQ